MPIRWVFVHDLDGTHEDRYFFSTDISLSPSKIIALYTARWSIEVTFQETREHLGPPAPRNRKDKSVLRTECSAKDFSGAFSVAWTKVPFAPALFSLLNSRFYSQLILTSAFILLPLSSTITPP